MLNLVLVNKLQNNIMSSTESLTQDINYENTIETGK